MPNEKFVSVRQAARLLKVDSMTVYRHIWAKKLRAYKRNPKQWKIPVRALEALARKRAGQTAPGVVPNKEGLPKATA